MEIKVEVNPEQVNQAVAQAIINSTLGESLKKAVEKEASRLSSVWNNPLDDAVRGEVHIILSKYIRDEYAPKLKEMVKERLTDDALNKIIDEMWKKAGYLTE